MYSDDSGFGARQFSLLTGGPFYQLSRRLHLLSPRGTLRVFRVATVLWLPIALGTGGRLLLGYAPDPLVYDISVHTRFLISWPLLVLAGRLVDVQANVVVTQLYNGQFARRADLDAIFDRAERLRDNAWVEAAIAAVALAGGAATLLGLIGPSGVVHGGATAGHSLMRFYYAGFGLPLLQFVAVRWLWRWGVWSYTIIMVSRLPLRTLGTHPDRAGGLGFVGAPLTGFSAFVASLASVLSAAWLTQILEGRMTAPAALPTLLVFLVSMFAIGYGPLLFFTPHLYKAQRKALNVYGPLALDYMRQFHLKWIDRRRETTEALIGNPDIQSMADMGNAFNVVLQTRIFIFGKKKLIELWLAAVVPMLPLVATVISITEVFKRLGNTLVGGLLL
jgi:hypothetical protein